MPLSVAVVYWDTSKAGIRRKRKARINRDVFEDSIKGSCMRECEASFKYYTPGSLGESVQKITGVEEKTKRFRVVALKASRGGCRLVALSGMN
jgi:hypothetical protein